MKKNRKLDWKTGRKKKTERQKVEEKVREKERETNKNKRAFLSLSPASLELCEPVLQGLPRRAFLLKLFF